MVLANGTRMHVQASQNGLLLRPDSGQLTTSNLYNMMHHHFIIIASLSYLFGVNQLRKNKGFRYLERKNKVYRSYDFGRQMIGVGLWTGVDMAKSLPNFTPIRWIRWICTWRLRYAVGNLCEFRQLKISADLFASNLWKWSVSNLRAPFPKNHTYWRFIHQEKPPSTNLIVSRINLWGDRSSLAISGIIFSAGLGPASSNVGLIACGPRDFLPILCLNLNPQSSTAFYSSLFIIIESNKSWWPVAWLRCERVIVLSKLIRYIAIGILYTKIRCS